MSNETRNAAYNAALDAATAEHDEISPLLKMLFRRQLDLRYAIRGLGHLTNRFDDLDDEYKFVNYRADRGISFYQSAKESRRKLPHKSAAPRVPETAPNFENSAQKGKTSAG